MILAFEGIYTTDVAERRHAKVVERGGGGRSLGLTVTDEKDSYAERPSLYARNDAYCGRGGTLR